MDIAAFTSDVDELVEAFVQIGGLELSQMKELWRSRCFTFIHEAKPTQVNAAFFMQALYSSALDFLEGNLPWSKKLGGLYVLYILYETQLSIPPFKIYLSTDNLENIYSLVKQAKANGPLTALRVVNRMMVRDFFLYGSVSISGKKMRDTFRELSSKATEHLQHARKRLFENSSAKQHFEGNLIKDLGLDGLALLNQEYAMVKQRVYKGAASTEEDFDNLGSILGDELKKDVNSWMDDRKRFFGKQGQEIVLYTELQGQEKGSEMEFGANDRNSFFGKEGQESVHDTELKGRKNGSGEELSADGGLDDDGFERELERALDED
eukprot:c9885_g1_i1 orf=174-1139(+)